ncbi:hypothetical protein DENSPDRAFT_254437 [Dentipellis sp. KUC8613]|nr:hypothetical protein DENSPDRAFT_254437 [Dentipellis sp. KUC8613]
MTSPPTSTLPAPLPLRAILEECAEMEVEERNLLLRNFLSHHWPDRAEMIMHYVGQTDNCVWYPQRWRPAHRVYPHPEGSPFDRLGLNMSPGLFNIAKTIIFSISKDESLNWDNLLTLKLSPYVILYACLDYNSPFPVSFDIQFFLDHLSHLIATGRTEDLFMRQNDVPNASLRFFDGKVVHDELNDPDDVLETLHTFMVSGGGQLHRLSVLPHVYLAADAKSTAAVYRTDDLKTFQPAFKRSFCLGPPSTHLLTLTDSQSRLADAALHAAVCWAPLWEGWAVNFQVPSVRAAWALNDSADFSDEFPALEALHTLAAHFCFNIHAGLVVPERRTASGTTRRPHSRRAQDSATRQWTVSSTSTTRWARSTGCGGRSSSATWRSCARTASRGIRGRRWPLGLCTRRCGMTRSSKIVWLRPHSPIRLRLLWGPGPTSARARPSGRHHRRSHTRPPPLEGCSLRPPARLRTPSSRAPVRYAICGTLRRPTGDLILSPPSLPRIIMTRSSSYATPWRGMILKSPPALPHGRR